MFILFIDLYIERITNWAEEHQWNQGIAHFPTQLTYDDGTIQSYNSC